MIVKGHWWWPGLRSFLRSLRFGVVALGLGLVLGFLGTGVDALRPLTDRWETLAVVAIATAGALGTRQAIGWTLFLRLSRTHQELNGANSPIELIYHLAVGAAAFTLAQRLALGVPPAQAAATSIQSLLVVVALAVAYVAGGVVSGLWPERRDDFERVPTGGSETIRFRDEPITRPSQDLLGRGRLSGQLVESCIGTGDRRVAVLALEGSTGAGKSSLVNMTRYQMTGLGILHAAFPASIATNGRLRGVAKSSIERVVQSRYAFIDIRGSIANYYRLLRPIAGVAAVALPELQEPRTVNRALLETLSRIKTPVVLFVDDVDRLTGPEILELLAGISTLDLPLNLVFVLVYDRNQVVSSLSSSVPDASAYLRASVGVVIHVPDPPADVVYRELGRLVDVAAAQHKLKVEPERGAGQLLPSDWSALFPTLHDVKHLANAFADRLSMLAGEIYTWDLLLATALDLVVPQVLTEVKENPAIWLVSVPIDDQLGASVDKTLQRDRLTLRTQRLAELVGDVRPRRQVEAFVDNLFPPQVDPGRAKADARMVDYDSFVKYREQRVAPTVAPDIEIAALLARVNAAGGSNAEGTFVDGILASTRRLDLLSRLVLRAEAFAPEVRRSVVIGCAALSARLSQERLLVDVNEFERAQALVFSLLELGREDVSWQESTIDSAIRASSALEFARALITQSQPYQNRILSRIRCLS